MMKPPLPDGARTASGPVRASVASVVTVALSALCSAGAPCCGGGEDTRTVFASYPLKVAGVDAGARAGGVAGAADAGDGGDAGDAGEPDAADASAGPSKRETLDRDREKALGKVRLNQPVSKSLCTEICTGTSLRDGSRLACEVSQSGGQFRVDCIDFWNRCNQSAGRRPAGASLAEGRGRTLVGAYLASVARSEADSVLAFEWLARDLEAHGGPADLIGRARRAAQQEREHAGLMAAMAHAYEGRVSPSRPQRWEHRSLLSIALENAEEGCVRETFGALVASYQAQNARDLRLRQIMRQVAAEEIEHAELSRDVHVWAMGQLGDAERGLVARGMEAARRTLPTEMPEGDVRGVLGLPTSRGAEQLAAHMFDQGGHLRAA